MTDEEKLQTLKVFMNDSTTSDVVLNTYLKLASSKILNQRFPFDKESRSKPVPEEFEMLQIELACTLINKRGAEGETSHSENGVNRTYRTEKSILYEITPLVGVM